MEKGHVIAIMSAIIYSHGSWSLEQSIERAGILYRAIHATQQEEKENKSNADIRKKA